MSDATDPDFTPAQHRNGNLAPRWQPGTSGNPAGRPKGARSRLSEGLIRALAEDFETHGVSVIAKVRDKNPVEYLQIVSRLVPRELTVDVDVFHQVSDIVEAFRLASGIIGADEEVVRKYLPALEHDGD